MSDLSDRLRRIADQMSREWAGTIEEAIDALADHEQDMAHVLARCRDLELLYEEICAQRDAARADSGRLRDQVESLQAALAGAERERDAITRLCWHHFRPGLDGAPEFYRLKIDAAPGDEYDFDTEAEAVAAVRRAAGLDAKGDE